MIREAKNKSVAKRATAKVTKKTGTPKVVPPKPKPKPKPKAKAPKAKVAIVQGNIDQKIKNAAKGGAMDYNTYRSFVLDRYLPLSRAAEAAVVQHQQEFTLQVIRTS